MTDSYPVLSSLLSIALSLIQVIWLAWIIRWLNKQRKVRKQAPTLPQATALVSQWVPPTFNPSLRAPWRRKTAVPKSPTDLANVQERPDVESQNHVEDERDEDSSSALPLAAVESEIIPDVEAELEKLKDVKGVANASPSDENGMVLPIYYKFLLLQAFHCLLWVIMCVGLVASKLSFVDWGDNKPGFLYYIGSGMLVGVGTALLDGVQFFLSQDSVGRKSIGSAYKFAFGWGMLNAVLCTILSSVGHARDRQGRHPVFTQIPWRDPFFVRTLLMCIFNFMLMFTVLGRRALENCERSNDDDQDEPQRVYETRDAWIGLALFNFFGSGALIFLYEMHHLRTTSVWATVLLCGFLAFFLGYTPVLYRSLLRDSQYWRQSWIGALSSIDTPFLKSADKDTANIVIDMNAIEYRQVLGKGGFSTVYRGYLWTAIQMQVAIKILHVEEMTKEVVERFLEEVRIFVKFRHPNVVHFVGASISPPDFAIVMELCKPRSLADLLKAHNEKLYQMIEAERTRLKKQRGSSSSHSNKENRGSKVKKGNSKIITQPHVGIQQPDPISLNGPARDMELDSTTPFTYHTKGEYLEDDPADFQPKPKRRNSEPDLSDSRSRSPMPRTHTAEGPIPLPPSPASPLPPTLSHSPRARDSFSRKRTTAPRQERTVIKMGAKGHLKLFSTKKAVEIALAIADAMKYMHSHQILHRDLKSSNILFDAHDHPKICDFGLSRAEDEITEANSFAGTIAYMSPEVLRMEKVTEKSDVYSFAVIFWELLTSKLAWTKYSYLTPELEPVPKPRAINPLVIMEKVAHHRARPPIHEDDNIHPVLHVLLRECWADDQGLRPSFEMIVDRLETFQRSQHFRRFGDQAEKFGEGQVTKLLKT